MTNRVWHVDWDTDHLDDFDLDIDAELVLFDGYANIAAFCLPQPAAVPTEIVFEACFAALDEVEFPTNDQNWPIMSRNMLAVLVDVAPLPPHAVIPVIMVDDTLPEEARRDVDGSWRPGAVREDFVILHLLAHEDRFDWDKSDYNANEEFEDEVDTVRRLAISNPGDPSPPIFRFSALPENLFLSDAARIALEKAGIQGLEITPIEEFTC